MRTPSLTALLCTAATLLPLSATGDTYTGTGFSITVAPSTTAQTATPTPLRPAPKVATTTPAPPAPTTPAAPVFAAEPVITAQGLQAGPLQNPTTHATPKRPNGAWFGTGIIDATFGGFGHERFEQGRVAGYVEGTTHRGVAITASGDTREGPLKGLFSDLGARDPDRVLDRLREEQNYLTYGDDSTITDGAPTSGKIFVDARTPTKSFTWGDFRVTDESRRLVRTDRTLYGARASAQSAPGDTPTVKADAWAASPDRTSRQDILRATGGAIFSLARGDVLPGTEKVIVRTRDRLSGRVIDSQTLVQGIDYRINTFQGLLIVSQPPVPALGEDVVRELAVTYEHIPQAGDPSSRIVGGRVESRPTHNTLIGVGGHHEEGQGATHRLYGVDADHQGDGYQLRIEAARSEGTRIGSVVTDTYGFGATPAEDTVRNPNASGHALRVDTTIDTATHLGVPGTITAWHERISAGFVGADRDIVADQTDNGITATTTLGRATLTAGVSTFHADDGRRKEDAAASITSTFGASTITAGLLATDRRNPDTIEDNGARHTAQLRWKRALGPHTDGWIIAQHTLHTSGDIPRDDRIGAGARHRFNPRWAIEGEVSDGDLGQAGYVALERTYEDGTSSFGLRKETNDPSLDANTRNQGYAYTSIQRSLTSALSMTAEGRHYTSGRELGHTGGFGLTWARDGWSISGLWAQGDLRDTESATTIDRQSLSVGIAYSDSFHQGAVRLETRRDDSNDTDRAGQAHAITGTYQYRLNDDWRLVSNLAFLDARGGSSFDAGRALKAEIGGAWRSASSDRWSALALLSRVEDQPGTGVVRDDGDTDRQKATVVSLDTTWQATPRWSYGAKLAYRWLDTTPADSQDTITSSSGLGVLRADYNITPLWSLSADLRVQTFRESDSMKTGATFGAWRAVGSNAKIGLGYHAGGIHSDLRNLDTPETGAFLNIVAAF